MSRHRGTHREQVRFGRRSWLQLLTLSGAVLIEGMSLSSINVQLSEIRRELGLAPNQLQLVASGFLVSYAGLLLVSGKLADRWGHRRMFRLGVLTFGAGSLAAALARNSVDLIAARAVQGAGAAITVPASVALIVALFAAPAARARALGVLSAMGALGFSLGVVAGGLVTQTLDWRWAFGGYVPCCLLVLAGSYQVPALVPAARSGPRVPWLPAVLATSGLTLLVYAAGRVDLAGPTETLAGATTGLLLLGACLRLPDRPQSRLISTALLRSRPVGAACLGLGGGFAGVVGAMFITSTSLHDQHQLSPLAVGFVFLPQGIAVGVLSIPAARLAARWPAARLLGTGLLILAGGQLLYLTAGTGGYLTHLLPATVLAGAGIAVTYPAATLLTSTAAAATEQATASAVLTTCQQAGGALGVAIATGAQSVAGPGAALAVCLGLVVLSGAGCRLLLPGSHPLPEPVRTSSG